MAFPTIADADTTSGTVTSNSDPWTLTYPTNIAAGDLLLLFVGMDGNAGTTLSLASPWQPINAGTNAACALWCWGRIADGTETGTFSFDLSGAEQGGWRVFRIPAASWFGSGLPSATGAHDGVGVDAALSAGVSANPDPAVLDPGQWATEDTLWFAACGVDTSRTISVYPLAGRNTADVSGGSTGATLGVCTTTSAVSSLDPGTFTISSSDDWGALTVAVRPAAAAFLPRVSPYPQLLAH